LDVISWLHSRTLGSANDELIAARAAHVQLCYTAAGLVLSMRNF
jgi:hypothetical protein